MARQSKTGKNNRTTYIYYDSRGNKQIELRPGEDGVTEADISMLHEMDDAEFITDRRENRRTPYRYDSYRSDGEDADEKNPWLADSGADPEIITADAEDAAEHELRLEKLPEAMAALLPAQRALYEKVYVQKRKYTDIAAEEGVTEAAIRNRLKKIHERLRKFYEK